MEDRLAVREYFENLLRQKGDLDAFGDADALISSGRLSSFDAIELVYLLEEKHGFDFSDGQHGLGDLDSVDSVMNLLGSR